MIRMMSKTITESLTMVHIYLLKKARTGTMVVLSWFTPFHALVQANGDMQPMTDFISSSEK